MSVVVNKCITNVCITKYTGVVQSALARVLLSILCVGVAGDGNTPAQHWCQKWDPWSRIPKKRKELSRAIREEPLRTKRKERLRAIRKEPLRTIQLAAGQRGTAAKGAAGQRGTVAEQGGQASLLRKLKQSL